MKLDLGHSNKPSTPDEAVADKTPSDGSVPSEPRPFLDRAGDEVAAWFGNVDALGRRQRDEAVGDHAGKGPSDGSAPDARLLADATDRLTQDATLDASRIRITVLNGTIVLSGSVTTAADRAAAERDTLSVGATHVVNNLMVG